jgi:type I restriction enzyme S subunit
VDPDFLYFYLESQYQQIRGLSNSGGQQNLNTELVRNIPIPLAPLGEQQHIATVLAAWDRALQLIGRLITAKRERKRWMLQQALTGRRRFSNFVRSVATQHTPTGSLPAEWNFVEIGEIARQIVERNRADRELPVLSCTKYDGLVDSLEYFGKQIFSDDTSTYKVVRRHQFAYATNHIEEGSIGYQDLYDEALISPMYTVFETGPRVNDRFLYALLKTETYRQIFEQNTSASVNRRGSLRWDEFSRIKVPLPSLLEQTAIADVLNICDQEIALLNRKQALLKQQKRGLMQQLLMGKVQVPS